MIITGELTLSIIRDLNAGGPGVSPPPWHGPSIVQEDNFYILLEDGTSSILLE